MAEIFKWCGYEWFKSANDGRLIHPEYPNYWYDPCCITEMGDGVLALSIVENHKEIRHRDGKTMHAVFDNWPRYAKDYGSVIDLPLKQPFLIKGFRYTEL